MKDRVTNRVFLEGILHNGLYRFNLRKKNQHTKSNEALVSKFVKVVPQKQYVQILSSEMSSNSVYFWRRILGHPSLKTVTRVLKNCNISEPITKDNFCSTCQLGKNHKSSFPCSNTVYSELLQLIGLIFGDLP